MWKNFFLVGKIFFLEQILTKRNSRWNAALTFHDPTLLPTQNRYRNFLFYFIFLHHPHTQFWKFYHHRNDVDDFENIHCDWQHRYDNINCNYDWEKPRHCSLSSRWDSAIVLKTLEKSNWSSRLMNILVLYVCSLS